MYIIYLYYQIDNIDDICKLNVENKIFLILVYKSNKCYNMM